jgi:hypothetical protein
MIPALVLVFLTVIFRIATAIVVQGGGAAWLSNFAPLAAIALCGAIYFPSKYKFTVPFAACWFRCRARSLLWRVRF